MTDIIFVTGDRNWSDHVLIHQTVARHKAGSWLVEGGATGADRYARVAAERLGFQPIEMPALWTKLGKAAGAIRNRQMLDLLKALRTAGHTIHAYAFHDDLEHSKGTKNMVALLDAAGFRWTLVTHQPAEFGL